MRAYPAASEDTLCARKLLADWAGEGFVTKEQFERLQQETVSDLRTTNIFLRLVAVLLHAGRRGSRRRAVLRDFPFGGIGPD